MFRDYCIICVIIKNLSDYRYFSFYILFQENMFHINFVDMIVFMLYSSYKRLEPVKMRFLKGKGKIKLIENGLNNICIKSESKGNALDKTQAQIIPCSVDL